MSASMGLGAIPEVPAPLRRPYAGMESFSPRMSQAKHDKWEHTASLLREAMHAQTAAHAQALQEQQDSHFDRHRQLQRDMEALKMSHSRDQKDQQERYFTKVKELENALQAKEQFFRQLRRDVEDMRQSHEGALQAQKERFQRQLEAKAISLQELQDSQQELWTVLQDMDMAHDKALEDQKAHYERSLQEQQDYFQCRLQEKDESHQRQVQELLATRAAESSGGGEAQAQKQHYERLLKEKDESHQRQVQELAATKAAEGSDREVQEQKEYYERLLKEKDDSHQRQVQELLATKAAERKREAENPVLAANTAAHGSGREAQATGAPPSPDEASAKQKARASLIQAARDGSLEKSLQDFRQKAKCCTAVSTCMSYRKIWKTTASGEEQLCQGASKKQSGLSHLPGGEAGAGRTNFSRRMIGWEAIWSAAIPKGVG
eukprot:s3864_g1.t2